MLFGLSVRVLSLVFKETGSGKRKGERENGKGGKIHISLAGFTSL